MPFETPPFLPDNYESLFADNIKGPEKRTNFFLNFPPECLRGDSVRAYGTTKEKEDWQFGTYDKRSGEVTLFAGRNENEGKIKIGYNKKMEMPLMDFYMLNPGKIPKKDIRLPLGFFVDSWDTYSPEGEQIVDEDGIKDSCYDYLKSREDTEDSLLNTLISFNEGRSIMHGMRKAVQGEPEKDSESSAIKKEDLDKRNIMFNL